MCEHISGVSQYLWMACCCLILCTVQFMAGFIVTYIEDKTPKIPFKRTSELQTVTLLAIY
jgi:hypothetical protein